MPILDFKGKYHVYAHHLSVPFRPLVPDAKKSLGASNDGENLIVHGDNLDALKALMPRYADRVDIVYIDPPYNTGNEKWIYNDNVNSPKMREWLKEQSPVDDEDLERHDKWLCMMWPRLQLLRELMADNGIIFVSVDQNEQHHLKTMMDEIFGEDNFFALLTRRAMHTVRNSSKDFNLNADYVLEPYEHAFDNGVRWRPPEGSFPRYSPEKLRCMERDGRIKGLEARSRTARWATRLRPTACLPAKPCPPTRPWPPTFCTPRPASPPDPMRLDR